MIFTNVNFSIHSGEALVVIGCNGSGKTSLLRIMAGLMPSWRGVLTWNEEVINDHLEVQRERVHYIGHVNGIKSSLTPFETLVFWSSLRCQDDPIDRAYQALRDWEVDHLAHVPCRHLSLGQCRRVGLARLLTSCAKVWLLDEPHTSLDHESCVIFDTMMTTHRARGGMVILTSHVSERHGLDRIRYLALEECITSCSAIDIERL